MPRIPHSLLLRAHRISPLLPLVLRGCRELPSAVNELRWLREHVADLSSADHKANQARQLFRLCQRRARGEPLQYLLGTQPFGELEIKCRPGVLIPRPETEAFTSHLAEILLKHHVELAAQGNLKIIDFCTGSGCIALLLHSLLGKRIPGLSITGVDISPDALALARDNLQHNVKNGVLDTKTTTGVKFVSGDLLSSQSYPSSYDTDGDIIVSNPPYISEHGFNKETSRSVRNWEPKLALVPCVDKHLEQEDCAPQDIFYHKLLTSYGPSKSRIMLLEVGDSEQAVRVAHLAAKYGGKCEIQIWRDWPNEEAPSEAPNAITVYLQHISDGSGRIGRDVSVVGSGKARSVLIVWGTYTKMLPEIHHKQRFAQPSTSLDWETI